MRRRGAGEWGRGAVLLVAVARIASARAEGVVEEARAALVALHPDGARVQRWSPTPGLTERAQIQELLGTLGDPSTRLLGAAQWKAFVAEVSGQPTVGVGLRELLDVDLVDGNLAVVTTQPGGAAARSGLRPGDVLQRVDGAELRGRGLSEGMERLRGQAGTSAHVDLGRGEQRISVDLPRESLPAEGSHVRSALIPGGLLHLAVDGFSPATVGAVREALAGRPTVPVVLDLRNNPGGQLEAALGVAGLFVGERDVAKRRAKAGTRGLRSTGRRVGKGKVVVLVNAGTASAAELLALALRDAGHAPVVGTRTRGKALIHLPQPLADGSWLLVSSGRIVALDGSELLDRGITPLVAVEWSDSFRVPLPVPGSPEDDPQLAAGLEQLARHG